MFNRTTHSTVHFTSPFSLPGLKLPLPAGFYAIDTEEEMIDGLSFVAYRRTGTYFHVPADAATSRLCQMINIAAADLEAALELDRGQVA